MKCSRLPLITGTILINQGHRRGGVDGNLAHLCDAGIEGHLIIIGSQPTEITPQPNAPTRTKWRYYNGYRSRREKKSALKLQRRRNRWNRKKMNLRITNSRSNKHQRNNNGKQIKNNRWSIWIRNPREAREEKSTRIQEKSAYKNESQLRQKKLHV